MYKLVAIDLDGTLLDMNKEISERNKKAIGLARKKGVRVVICSGRVYTGARLYAKQLNLNDPIIACNGAIITDGLDGNVIHSEYLNTEECFKIIDICKQHDVYYHVYAGNTMLTERLGFTSLKYYEKNKALPEKDRVDIQVVKDMKEEIKRLENKVLKFVIVTDQEDLLKQVRKDMLKVPGVDIMSSNFDNFEVVNKGVNKGAALKKLSEIYGISGKEMIAIGDNENDISMLKFAGLGVAMANGEDLAKDAASYVTAANTEDGVALAIEKFILGHS